MAVPHHSDAFSRASVAASEQRKSSSSPPLSHDAPALKRARTHADSIAAMVPLADFCNHSHTRSLSHFEWSRGLGGGLDALECVSLVCDVDISKGEEVFICYGAKTTAELLCFYGFDLGEALACDALHVVLVMPVLAPAADDGGSLVARDDDDDVAASCLAFLSQCSLCIGDDSSITCALSPPPPSTPPPPTPPPTPPLSITSHHRILHCSACVAIPSAIVRGIQLVTSHSHADASTSSLICKAQAQGPVPPIKNCDIETLGSSAVECEGDWLQVRRCGGISCLCGRELVCDGLFVRI